MMAARHVLTWSEGKNQMIKTCVEDRHLQEPYHRRRVLMRMQKAKDFLELASHCESEAAKVQDKFLRYQLLSFAESYRTLAESTAALERSAEALENMRRKAQGRM